MAGMGNATHGFVVFWYCEVMSGLGIVMLSDVQVS